MYAAGGPVTEIGQADHRCVVQRRRVRGQLVIIVDCQATAALDRSARRRRCRRRSRRRPRGACRADVPRDDTLTAGTAGRRWRTSVDEEPPPQCLCLLRAR